MRALIVDDSRVMRMLLARELQKLGFVTSEAGDGHEALARLESVPAELPDLITVDWNMPGMNGLDLVQRIRAEVPWRGVTLLMVTTESEYTQVVRALAAGAHEYLIKPFQPEALGEKLALLGLAASGSLR